MQAFGRVALVALLGMAVALPATAQAADAGLDAYEVPVADGKALDRLAAQGFDLTEGRRGSEAEIAATAGQAAKLRGLGLKPELKRDRNGLTARQYDARVQRPDGSYDVYRPYFDRTYVGTDTAGQPRETLYEELTRLANSRPDLVKPMTIGRSVNGTPILALKITDNARTTADGQRPAVLYSATQHAREWIVPEMDRRLFRYVLENYGADSDAGREVSRIVNTTELWFVPVANPDGYDFTFTPGNRLWRKNLREINGIPGIQTGDGVDPNRNFTTKWGYDNEGSSPVPSSETYRGTGPNSEPETQAMDGLLRRIGFEFQVNYHSAAELLLYPLGFQVETPVADEPIYRALSGTDERPAIAGSPGPEAPKPYDPDIGAELYTTNGETTDHAHGAYGTLAWTPEMDESDPERGGGESVFEFQDSEGDVEAAFRKNIPFALDVAKSAKDPANPVSHLGNATEAFELRPFSVSYGDPQTVEVNAKRQLGPVTLHWRIGGGEEQTAPTAEWQGGERFGEGYDVYYHRMRGAVTGTRPGDDVRVWFEGGGQRSQSFTYRVRSDSGNPVLILSAEDYSGKANTQSPAQTQGPAFLASYQAAVRAAGLEADVFDVDAEGRTAPDALGVLSHYRAVIWYTGNDVFIREPDAPGGTGTSRLADEEIIQVRSYLNEGGKLLYTGQNAATGQLTGFPYNPQGEPPYCDATGSGPGTVQNCVPLSNDFLQYYLGAYLHIDAAASKESASALGFALAGGPFGTTPFRLNGPESADNQEHVYSMVTTSSVLPASQFPQFASETAVAFQRPNAFDPVTGSYYAVAESDDESYQRLRRTVDLTGATSADLSFKLSYDTEADWDYVFVEAHTVGQDDWTTLPDVNGHTSDSVGASCDANWDTLHPFLARYQTNTNKSQAAGAEDCTATGTTGVWNAASGNSGGFEDWKVDLSAYAGRQVELSITYAQDSAVAGLGAFVDDVVLSRNGAAAEQTSFEDGLGGFTAGPAPAGSGNASGWERSTSVGFSEGPGVATQDTLYYGFGLEGVAGAANRAELVRRAMTRFGVLPSQSGVGVGVAGSQSGSSTSGTRTLGAGTSGGVAGRGPRLAISGRSVRASRTGVARVRVSCPRTARTRCRGSVRLLSGKRTLGRKAFSLKPAGKAFVAVKLSSSARRLLVRRGRLRVQVVVDARDASNRQRTSTKRITVLAPVRSAGPG